MATKIKAIDLPFISKLGVNSDKCHLVTSASVENDPLQKEIQIIRKIKNERKVYEKGQFDELGNYSREDV